MAIAPTAAPPHPDPTPAALSARWRDWLPLLIVVAVTLVLVVVQYREFLSVHRSLWYSGTHDRNSHYLFALRLAGAVRSGQILILLRELNGAAMWPPLHGTLAAVLLLIGGFDNRLAVLPSLTGWAMAMVFGFLIARRMVSRGGNLAGAVAALFIALSPSHRAYATDVMLESLGAGLSLAAVYAYLVVVQQPARTRRAGFWLALLLTALVLEKYNYYALVVVALMASELLSHPAWYWHTLSGFACGMDWRGLIRREVRRPTSWIIAIVLLLTTAIYVRGNFPLSVAGREIGIFPPLNILQIAYVIGFVRLILWWRKQGRGVVARLDVRLQQLIRWHLWPLACWLVLPKHFGYFLFYSSPANAASDQHASLSHGLAEYASWAITDYHVALAPALVAAALLAIALLAARRLRPGSAAVLCLVLLAAVLASLHPNRKSRNLHSWIAAGWVAAGAGAAVLVSGRLTAGFPRARPWLAGATLGGIALLHGVHGLPRTHAPEGGPHPETASLLDVTDSYLPELTGNEGVTILSAVGIRPMAQWTFLERYGLNRRLDEHWFGFARKPEDNRQAFTRWLQSTTTEIIVYVDERPGPEVTVGWEPTSEVKWHAVLRDLLQQQQVFSPVTRREFPQHGCTVTVWRRSDALTHAPTGPSHDD